MRKSMMTSGGACGVRSTCRSLRSIRKREAVWSRRSWLFSWTADQMRTRDDRREQLCRKVQHWSQRLNTEARIIRVQHMTRKWGSCSTTGIITLADDLIEQEPGFQDFVI